MSRLMPGMKDCVSVRIDGKKVPMQKRMVLCNLNELFTTFKSEHEDVKIGFTKFSQLRPKHCVLAGSSGTHTVCVCIYHENVKLMLKEIDLKYLTDDSPEEMHDYRDCLKLTMCPNATTSCHLGECSNCPGTTFIKENLIKSFDGEYMEEIKFESWLQSERCTLKTMILNVDDFVEEMCTGLLNLRTHDFLVKAQWSFFKDLKINLKSGEFVISYDFAENYKYVLQDAIQAYHFNNDQATVFTVVIYYMKDGKLEHKSMAIISDDLKHDTVAVYEYQKIILNYLKSKFEVQKVYYVSDGARQHFKNKSSFANLIAHEKDFGIPAEWHFHPTAHGKGACDGIGANLKRNAAKYSLQCSHQNRILDATALFNWAKNYCKETEIVLSSKDDHEETLKTLKSRIDAAVTINGTAQYHAFIPIGDGRLKLKKFSASTQCDFFPKPKKD